MYVGGCERNFVPRIKVAPIQVRRQTLYLERMVDGHYTGGSDIIKCGDRPYIWGRGTDTIQGSGDGHYTRGD